MNQDNFEDNLIRALKNLPEKQDAPAGFALRYRQSVKSLINSNSGRKFSLNFSMLTNKRFLIVGIAACGIGLFSIIFQSSLNISTTTETTANPNNTQKSLIDDKNSKLVSNDGSQTPCPTVSPSVSPSSSPTVEVTPTSSPSPSPECDPNAKALNGESSQSITATPTPTPTATPTPTPTTTPTPTPTVVKKNFVENLLSPTSITIRQKDGNTYLLWIPKNLDKFESDALWNQSYEKARVNRNKLKKSAELLRFASNPRTPSGILNSIYRDELFYRERQPGHVNVYQKLIENPNLNLRTLQNMVFDSNTDISVSAKNKLDKYFTNFNKQFEINIYDNQDSAVPIWTCLTSDAYCLLNDVNKNSELFVEILENQDKDFSVPNKERLKIFANTESIRSPFGSSTAAAATVQGNNITFNWSNLEFPIFDVYASQFSLPVEYEVELFNGSETIKVCKTQELSCAIKIEKSMLGNKLAYRVNAINRNGTYTDAMTRRFIKNFPTGLPSAPIFKNISLKNNNATISWDPSISDFFEIKNYIVYSTVNKIESKSCEIRPLDDLTCEVKGLNPGTSASLKVLATNELGQSVPLLANIVVPNKTINNNASWSGDQLIVKFEHPYTNLSAKNKSSYHSKNIQYRVILESEPAGSYKKTCDIRPSLASVGIQTCVFNSPDFLKPNLNYAIFVSAFENSIESEISMLNMKTLTMTAPLTPTWVGFVDTNLRNYFKVQTSYPSSQAAPVSNALITLQGPGVNTTLRYIKNEVTFRDRLRPNTEYTLSVQTSNALGTSQKLIRNFKTPPCGGNDYTIRTVNRKKVTIAKYPGICN